MIVDTSALIAILFHEPEAPLFAKALAGTDVCRISAVCLVEASIVVETYAKDLGVRQLDMLLRKAAVRVEPVTEEQAYTARQAYTDYGKGRHAAGLNLGDCFSYALAKAYGEPLLFKGADFTKTDVGKVTIR